MTTLAPYAIQYLDAGFSIIALSGKAPNAAFHPKGLNNAISGQAETDNERELIALIFNDPETTGIGIVLQYPYVVLDVDGEQGAKELAAIMGGTDVDEWAAVAKTGRGLHIWFQDYRVNDGRRTRSLSTKLDLKGVGGYVVVPPSLHPAGHRYEWLRPLIGLTGLPDLPPQVVAWMEEQDRLDDQHAVEQDAAPSGHWKTLLLTPGRLQMVDAPANIAGLVQWMTDQPEGNRNRGLHWAASVARDEGIPYEEAMDSLGEAARAAGLDAREARRTIRSAYRRRR